jgi:hypothetical protein
MKITLFATATLLATFGFLAPLKAQNTEPFNSTTALFSNAHQLQIKFWKLVLEMLRILCQTLIGMCHPQTGHIKRFSVCTIVALIEGQFHPPKLNHFWNNKFPEAATQLKLEEKFPKLKPND